MPAFGPTARRDLVRALHALGFDGPYRARRHEFMVGRGQRVVLPNSHRGDISAGLLSRILRQAGVSREEWEDV